MNTMKFIRKSVNAVLLLFFTILIFNGCKKSSDNQTINGSPGPNVVWMQNTAFNPTPKTITIGTTITWTNKDNMDHTVTSNNAIFQSGVLSNGATFNFKFTTAGTYDYHCTIHSGMTGRIIVQ
jgi:plastocyanin